MQKWQEFEHANDGRNRMNRVETDHDEHSENAENEEEDTIKINLDVQINKTSKRLKNYCVAKNHKDEIQLV